MKLLHKKYKNCNMILFHDIRLSTIFLITWAFSIKGQMYFLRYSVHMMNRKDKNP